MSDLYLQKYLSSYSTLYAYIMTFNSIIFAASIFLLIRHYKIIVDKDVPPIYGHGWIIGSLVIASISVTSAVLAEAQIASFYNEMFKHLPASGCSMNQPEESNMSIEAFYFQECNRPILANFNIIALLGSGLSFSLLAVWFTYQVRRMS